MRRSSIFWASFLDGFTFAGFLAPLRQPGAATRVFAAPKAANSPFDVSKAGENSSDGEFRHVLETLGIEEAKTSGAAHVHPKVSHGSSG
jgi:hypothetical protein